MYLKIHPITPSERQIRKVVESLNENGVIIYPTDTVYALGCDIRSTKAAKKIALIKHTKLEKANFSFICKDLSQSAEYTRNISNNAFKMMKKLLPGPYTFILNGNNKVPTIFKNNKKTVGIRIPNANIPCEIVRLLGNPILTTSLHSDDDILEYHADPELIKDKYHKMADIIIDGGIGEIEPSTVIDFTQDEFRILRQGKGRVD